MATRHIIRVDDVNLSGVNLNYGHDHACVIRMIVHIGTEKRPCLSPCTLRGPKPLMTTAKTDGGCRHVAGICVCRPPGRDAMGVGRGSGDSETARLFTL
jgi:hypothetical protein